jgi:putative peptidoglycan lipid II flippase
MVRDILSSHYFGAGMFMDAFAIAYRIPNLFRRLFGEGALSAAFLPSFVGRIEAGRREEAFALLNRLITLLVAALGGITLLGIAFTFGMARLWPGEKTELIAELLRIMLPYCLLACAGALLGAALNGLYKFFAPAFAPVLLNLTWIAALVSFASRWEDLPAIRAVAWAIIAGGVLQLLMMAIPLWRAGARYRPVWEPRDSGVREVGARFLPAVLGLALVQINEVVDSIIAELLVPGDGAVASLYYANLLTQLPLSLIGTSLATAAFPGLTAAAAKGDDAGFGTQFRSALSMSLYLGLPATAGLALFSEPIIGLIYEHGAFTRAETMRVGATLAMFAAGLFCYCANQVQVRAFHALKDTRTPARVSMIMAGVNFLLNLTLVWPLAESGIALATSLSGAASFVTLGLLLKRRRPDLDLAPVGRTFALAAAASATMGAALWGAAALLPSFGASKIAEGARLGLLIAFAIGFYVALTLVLKMPEATQLLRRRR